MFFPLCAFLRRNNAQKSFDLLFRKFSIFFILEKLRALRLRLILFLYPIFLSHNTCLVSKVFAHI